MNARIEQFQHPDTAPPGDSEGTTVSDVSTNDEWAAKYREAAERDRRFLRLLHTSAALFIAVTAATLGILGAVGLAVRVLIIGPIVYLILWTVVGLFLQWRREIGVNDT